MSTSHSQPSPVLAWSLCLALAATAVAIAHSALALVLGVVFVLLLPNADISRAQRYSSWTLQTGVVLLGLTLPLAKVAATSGDYGVIIGLSVLGVLALGALMGRCLDTETHQSQLITAGTAICGGTAVASLSPVIKAPPTATSQVLALVFILNAVALMIFPPMGEFLGLSPEQYGLWCALAIHDTSSVVGAASQFGPEALAVATTVKLARTLALVPLLVIAGLAQGRTGKTRIPLFVLAFVTASVIGTLLGLSAEWTSAISQLSKGLFCLALFLIGTTLRPALLRQLSPRLAIQGGILWLITLSGTLLIALR